MENNFSGVGTITSIQAEFYFSVLGFELTLTPKNTNDASALVKWVNDLNNAETIDWFVGTSNEGKSIYIEMYGEIFCTLRMPENLGAAKISYRLMVVGQDSYGPRNLKFDEIKFYGEDINLVNPPGRAIGNIENSFVYIDPKEYRKEWCIEVNSEEILLIKDISIQETISYNDVPDLKNNITSHIDFKFYERKSFSDIYMYYEYMKVLLSFLTGRTVNSFESKVECNEVENGDSRYYIFDVFINEGSKKIEVEKLGYSNVIQIEDIDNSVSNLFSLLNDKKISPYLFFLPETNDDKKNIKYTQIIDLSASIENEYTMQKPKGNSDLIKQSKELVNALVTFIGVFTLHPKVEEKALNVIQKTLTSYQPSFKEKIEYLYYRYKDDLEYITQYCCSELNFIEETVFLQKIRSFVSMRNSAAHRRFEWKEGADIFPHLMILVYFSIFERSGIDNSQSRDCIKRGFFKR